MTDLDYILLDAVKRREKRRFNRIEKAHYDQLIAAGFVRLTPSGEYRITKAGVQRLAEELARDAKGLVITAEDASRAISIMTDMDPAAAGDALTATLRNLTAQDTPDDTMRDGGTGDEAEES